MRIDHTLGWIVADSTPWIQIDMLNVYAILGLYLKKYKNYYVTLYHLKSSVDGVTHYYIGKNIVPDYLMNEDYTTYWFDNATDGRFWTIELVHNAYVNFPCVGGGGFIGYVWAGQFPLIFH